MIQVDWIQLVIGLMMTVGSFCFVISSLSIKLPSPPSNIERPKNIVSDHWLPITDWRLKIIKIDGKKYRVSERSIGNRIEIAYYKDQEVKK